MKIDVITDSFPEAGEIVSLICINIEGRTYTTTGTFDEDDKPHVFVGATGNNMYQLPRSCRVVGWFNIANCNGMFDVGPEFEDVPF